MIKKVLTLMLVSLMVLGLLAGCKKAPQPSGSGVTPSGEKPYVAVISKGFQHQFWQVVKKGAEAAAADLNVDNHIRRPSNRIRHCCTG